MEEMIASTPARLTLAPRLSPIHLRHHRDQDPEQHQRGDEREASAAVLPIAEK